MNDLIPKLNQLDIKIKKNKLLIFIFIPLFILLIISYILILNFYYKFYIFIIFSIILIIISIIIICNIYEYKLNKNIFNLLNVAKNNYLTFNVKFINQLENKVTINKIEYFQLNFYYEDNIKTIYSALSSTYLKLENNNLYTIYVYNNRLVGVKND